MKTIKQLREEYESKTLDQVQVAPDKLMLEGRDRIKSANSVPSPREMPAMLLFRRMAYRMYPNKQVVALYYSKTVNKYLSVPFGPDGNLNLSESTVYNTYEEIYEGVMAKTIEGGLKGAAHGAVRGFFKGAAVGALPGGVIGGVGRAAIDGYKGAKKAYDKAKETDIKESFKSKIDSKRQERVDEGLGSLLLKGLDLISNSGKGDKSSDTTKDDTYTTHKGELLRDKSKSKTYSSWKTARPSDAAYQSRLKSATTKDIQTVQQSRPVSENKISDLRNMIKEDKQELDLSINGRHVTLNSSMAKRILEVYDSVNTKNKKIVESMLNEDLESFKKLLNFSIKA